MNKIYIKLTVALLGVMLFTACSEEPAGDKSSRKATMKKEISVSRNFKVDDWQTIFGLQSGKQSINATISNEILLEGDRSIRIPAYSLMHQDGRHAQKAEISWFFVRSIDDAVACGLSTMDRRGRILVSEGMVYLDARSPEGESLYLAEQSAILFSIPENYSTSNQGVYYGVAEPDSSIVWEKTNRPSEEVIAFEAKELYPDDYWLNIPKEYYDLDDPKYDYTNLATKAVRLRLRRSEDLNHYLEWIWKEVHHDDPVIPMGNTFILDTYRNNLDKPIYYSDSIVVDMCRRVLDSCEQDKEKFCVHEKDIRTIMGVYEAFYHQGLKSPINLQPYIESLESDNPEAALEEQGIGKSRAGYLIEVYRRYKANLQALRDEKKASSLVSEFLIERLGWFNIDKLYSGGKLLYPRIVVSITEKPEDAVYRAILTVEKEKVLVPLDVKDGKVTMNTDGNDLGFDQFDKAVLHVWAVSSGKIFHGQIPITLFDDREYEVRVEELH